MVRKGTQLSSDFNNIVVDWLNKNNGDYLEIGSYYGVFLSEIAEKFPKINVYSIEPFITDAYAVSNEDAKEELKNEVKEHFNHNITGFGNIIHWENKTIDCLNEKKYEQLQNLSCILIDGSHKLIDIITDISFINNIKNKNDLLVIIDDMHVDDVLLSLNYFEQINHSKIMIKMEFGKNFICYILKHTRW